MTRVVDVRYLGQSSAAGVGCFREIDVISPRPALHEMTHAERIKR